eukprot:TRINITY_DN6558_c0_g1_i17.p1 TRINITY_DN6558_c0_g1~~TRINITY_DN6558_c0_g1_i17.p1  ORF type:complete len:268 (+),score=32.55 TRINITY_DN6558_c0_g1_i17:811-1614(+)
MTSRRTGTNWHSSRASRFIFTESEAKNNVGPGTYDAVRGIGLSKSKAKGTSSFTSAVPKSAFAITERPGRLQEDEEEYFEHPPGPGSYNPKSGAFEQRPFPSSIQQFGATASRFGTSNPLGTNLGPGYYAEGKKHAVRKPKSTVPFLSNTQRANTAVTGLNTPGPGEYPAKGIKDEVSKKLKGRQGVFGTTEKRFAQFGAAVKLLMEYDRIRQGRDSTQLREQTATWQRVRAPLSHSRSHQTSQRRSPKYLPELASTTSPITPSKLG